MALNQQRSELEQRGVVVEVSDELISVIARPLSA